MDCDYILHTNKWWWGKSIKIIKKDASGIVELKFDNDYPDIAFISDLSVHPDFQRHGIGTELIKYCEIIARENNKPKLELSVEKDHKWLFDWYLSLGFRVINKRYKHYFIMQKKFMKEPKLNEPCDKDCLNCTLISICKKIG